MMDTSNLTPLMHSAQNRCFGCGDANPHGLHLKFMLAEDRSVVCFARVGEFYEGPPGYVHGGILATLLDEAMSKAVRAQGKAAMTRQMEVNYLRPVASGRQIRVEGRVEKSEGRKHWTAAQILSEEGKVLAEATALFIEPRSLTAA